ncbi:MAG: FHA domain-containing protein [Myxococcales bacterium]|nr:FHA domain-containing protein [Myxococcales bacterium]
MPRRSPGSTQDFEDVHTRVATRVRGLRPRPERPHLLEVVDGPGKGTRFRLEAALYEMGRGANVSLQLDSDEVSRLHARLTRADGEYTVEDAHSRNGVLLNGLRVHAAVLRDGDELQLGDVVLKYLEGT